MLIAIVRALVLLISFTGLCAAIRSILKINRFIAPFMAVSGIICLLMFAGMLHILKPACYVLYAAGFAGFIYAYFIRRVKPDYPLIAAMLVFTVMLALCFYRLPLLRSDDFSHWGLAARHLLRYDAFPDRTSIWIQFQSYPLGSAAFIYYVARIVGNAEGIYLIAQNFLLGPLLLPLLAFIKPGKKNRGAVYAVAGLVFFLFFMVLRMLETLLVDMLLSMFAVAMSACIVYHKDDPKKALITAVPGMIAIVYVKNSGIFFAAINAVLMAYALMQRSEKRRSAYLAPLAAAALPIGAYMLWLLHIKISFPAALDTKHAVSLTAYASEASNKGFAEVMQILKAMKNGMLKSPPLTPVAIVLIICAVLLVCLLCRRLPDGRRQRRRMLKHLAMSVGVYVLWLVMIFCIYIFSMSMGEALAAAGFERYNATGVFYLIGLIAILFIPLFMRDEISTLKPLRLLSKAAPVLCALLLVVSCIWQPPVFDSAFVSRSRIVRGNLQAAREEYALQDGQKYMIYYDFTDPVMDVYKGYNLVKYEFEAADLQIVAEQNGEYAAGTYFDHAYCNDLPAFINEHIGESAALIMLHPSDNFEAELQRILGENHNIPVIHAYEQ